MKNFISYCGFLCFMFTVLFAQSQSDVIRVPLTKVLNPKEQAYDEWGVFVKNKTIKNNFGDEEIVNQKTILKQNNPSLSKEKTLSKSLLDLELGVNFRGLPKSATPSDNGTDISDDGNIVHTINANILMKDAEGNIILENSLSKFFDGKSGIFDPRVVYDHYEDRFIVVALTFSQEILIAFSQSNDPSGKWNLFTHKLEGSIDFPIIAINEYELMVTIVNFENGQEKLAYQIGKKEGYGGTPLRLKEHKMDASSLNIVTPADAFGKNVYGTKFYFVGINGRGGSTATLFEITDTLGGDPQIEKSEIDLPEEYSTGGKIKQKGSNKDIRIPNERFHKAIFYNGKVYGVFCTDLEKSGFHGLYYAQIDVASKEGLSFTYKKPNSDLVNPALALLPLGEGDVRVAISYQETNKDMYPALLAIGCDESGDWTAPLMVKEGVGSVGNADRLGDYTSCVTRFYPTPVFWVSGEYGGSNGRDNWIAEVSMGKINTGKEVVNGQPVEVSLGPNPMRENMMVSFKLDQDTEARISLFGIEGKLVKNFFNGKLKAGKNELYFNTASLSRGTYVIKIENNAGLKISKKIIKK